MTKATLLTLIARARKGVEQGDVDIEAQHEIIATLMSKGLDATKAREILAKLITAQEVDLTEMERLLDEMDNH
jgi:Fe2+ or Zn2+ uptake regulation protein